MPRISIVTPSFNQGRFLAETMDSVLGQGYPDLEYVVIDGGSKDDSVAVIESRRRTWRGGSARPTRGNTTPSTRASPKRAAR